MRTEVGPHARPMPRRRAALVIALLSLSAGCLARAPDIAAPPSGAGAVSIWVLGHGWHTSVVVRRADVDRATWPDVDDFPDATLIEVAWGDREFYMAEPATAWMAVKAAFGAGRSVLHVVGLDRPIAAHFPRSQVVELRLSRAALDGLARFVAREYERDERGRSRVLGRGLYGESRFYAARSGYSLSNTCNTWIARALEATGLPVTSAGVITAGGVMRQVTAAATRR